MMWEQMSSWTVASPVCVLPCGTAERKGQEWSTGVVKGMMIYIWVGLWWFNVGSSGDHIYMPYGSHKNSVSHILTSATKVGNEGGNIWIHLDPKEIWREQGISVPSFSAFRRTSQHLSVSAPTALGAPRSPPCRRSLASLRLRTMLVTDLVVSVPEEAPEIVAEERWVLGVGPDRRVSHASGEREIQGEGVVIRGWLGGLQG